MSDAATDGGLRAELLKGIARQNPVFVQALGLCPALAVTNSAINGLAMGLATLGVLTASSLLVSALRRAIPGQVRISTYIVIIATFVTVADFTLQALAPAVHRELGAFISLIVVNCIILGRAEAFASKNGVGRSLLDGLGMGLGFCLALLLLGVVREVLGSGSLFGVELFGPRWQDWVILVLPSGGFFTFAAWLLLFNWYSGRRQRRAAARGAR